MFSRLTSLLFREARFPRSLRLGLLAVAAASQAHGLSMPQRLFGAGSYRSIARTRAGSAAPYLAQIGAAPLRFAFPPPEPVERPALPDTDSAFEPILIAPESAPPTPVAASSATPARAAHSEPAATGPTPVRILPDDTPHEIRAEDVLPYFQLPSQGDRTSESGLNLPFTPAIPATLPPSSATYQLK